MVEPQVTADDLAMVNDSARSRYDNPDSSLGPRGEFIPLLEDAKEPLKPRKNRTLKHGRSNSETPLDKEAQDEIHPLGVDAHAHMMISEKPPNGSSYNATDESELNFSGLKRLKSGLKNAYHKSVALQMLKSTRVENDSFINIRWQKKVMHYDFQKLKKLES